MPAGTGEDASSPSAADAPPRARRLAAGWSAFWAAAPLNRLYLVVGSVFVVASFVSDYGAFTAPSRPDGAMQTTALVFATLSFLTQWWRSTVALAIMLVGAALTLSLPGPIAVVLFLPLVLAAAVATAGSRAFVGTAIVLSLLWAVAQPPLSTGEANAVWFLVMLVGLGAGAGLVLRAASRRREQDRVSLAAAERRAREAAVRERRVLARDLHDIVAHNLTIITMQARTAQYVGTPEAAADALEVVGGSARDALVDLRRMLAVLQEDGAVEAADVADGTQGATAADLASGAERMAGDLERLGVRTEHRVELGDAVLPLGVRTALFRVLQEAVTNVAKHAGEGEECAIRATVQGRDVVLVVENSLTPDPSGAGRRLLPWSGSRAAQPAGWNSSGVGIRSMRDRVEAYGGTLEAGPARGGWRVRAAVPLTGADHPSL